MISFWSVTTATVPTRWLTKWNKSSSAASTAAYSSSTNVVGVDSNFNNYTYRFAAASSESVQTRAISTFRSSATSVSRTYYTSQSWTGNTTFVLGTSTLTSAESYSESYSTIGSSFTVSTKDSLAWNITTSSSQRNSQTTFNNYYILAGGIVGTSSTSATPTASFSNSSSTTYPVPTVSYGVTDSAITNTTKSYQGTSLTTSSFSYYTSTLSGTVSSYKVLTNSASTTKSVSFSATTTRFSTWVTDIQTFTLYSLKDDTTWGSADLTTVNNSVWYADETDRLRIVNLPIFVPTYNLAATDSYTLYFTDLTSSNLTYNGPFITHSSLALSMNWTGANVPGVYGVPPIYSVSTFSTLTFTNDLANATATNATFSHNQSVGTVFPIKSTTAKTGTNTTTNPFLATYTVSASSAVPVRLTYIGSTSGQSSGSSANNSSGISSTLTESMGATAPYTLSTGLSHIGGDLNGYAARKSEATTYIEDYFSTFGTSFQPIGATASLPTAISASWASIYPGIAVNLPYPKKTGISSRTSWTSA